MSPANSVSATGWPVRQLLGESVAQKHDERAKYLERAEHCQLPIAQQILQSYHSNQLGASRNTNFNYMESSSWSCQEVEA